MKPPREYNARGMPLERKPEFPSNCRDCGRHDDGYMVVHKVWFEAFKMEVTSPLKRPKGLLCLDCLETRLGRLLTVEDFMPDVPINRGILLGFSMARDKIDRAVTVLKACASNPNEMLEEVEAILTGE